MFSQDQQDEEASRRIDDALRRVYDDLPENSGEAAFEGLLRKLADADKKARGERQKEDAS